MYWCFFFFFFLFTPQILTHNGSFDNLEKKKERTHFQASASQLLLSTQLETFSLHLIMSVIAPLTEQWEEKERKKSKLWLI